jgi:hypothetical protein
MTASTTDTDRATARDQQDKPPPMIHHYPHHPAYRRSGSPVPQVGDIALCGWVKRRLPVASDSFAPLTCVVCADLA